MTTLKTLLATSLIAMTLGLGACAAGTDSNALEEDGEEQVDAEYSAFTSSSKTVGDWSKLQTGYECLAALQYFYPAKFGVSLPVAGPGWYGNCAPHGACHLWLDKRPDSDEWERITTGEPETYDLIVYPPIGNDIWGHIAAVDHVENGKIFVMDDNYVAHHVKSKVPHTVGWPQYGWYHLKKLGHTGGNTGGTSSGNGGTCSAGGFYCGGDKVTGNKNTLYKCNGNGTASVVESCGNGCAVRPGEDDVCRACVVGGYYCGGDKVSGSASSLYQCNSEGRGDLVKHCSKGCSVNKGVDDSCK
jgi:hypothetical protein